MNRIFIFIIAVLMIYSFGAYAAPKIPAAQVSVDPALLGHSASTTAQAVLRELDSAIPGSATTSTPGVVRFATSNEVSSGTSTSTAISPADIKNALGSAPKITALVTFNISGTIVGTAYNVSSVTHPNSGVYVVHFATSMSNTTYGIVCSESSNGDGSNMGIQEGAPPTVNSVQVYCSRGAGAANASGPFDPYQSTIIIYGGK